MSHFLTHFLVPAPPQAAWETMLGSDGLSFIGSKRIEWIIFFTALNCFLESNVQTNQYLFNCGVLRCYSEELQISCTRSSGHEYSLGGKLQEPVALGVALARASDTSSSSALPLDYTQLFQIETTGSA